MWPLVTLEKFVGPHGPVVQPVLAIGIERGGIPELLAKPCEQDDVALLTADMVAKAMAKLRLGASHREISAYLPEVLRCGLEGLGRYRLYPSNGLI